MPQFTASGSTTATITESVEEPTSGVSSGLSFNHSDEHRSRHRQRRHSSYQPRSWSIERENVQVLVENFLSDLGKRLEMVEAYGHISFDSGVKRVHDTLHAVHDRCMAAGDDILDEGRRRHKVLVDILETHYRDALATKDTLEQKVREGVKVLESNLGALEQKAYQIREAGITATAHEMFDSSIAYMGDASTKAAEIVSDTAEIARRAKEALKIKVEEAVAQARKHGLITYEVLPDPWKVNPHIMTGYRFSETKLDCVRSCFCISNESFNIWSHILGLIMVIGLAFYAYPSTPAFASASTFDIVIAGAFFAAACKCMICSVMWHTMSSISNQSLMERFACVDYTGISFLVAASIMTTEYTAFYCEPISRWVYLVTTFVLGVAGTILPWNEAFNRADMSWVRVGFFVSLAATGFVPMIQLTLQRGWSETLYFYAPITKSVLVYLVGACLYAAKMPERWLPGWFDYAGGSHNIWHVAVLGGILFHYMAMQSFFSDAFARAESGACSSY